ncbi:MAG: zinc metallopeptidase [Trueperaceae bacterium]|nr:zinc metallopeptidase [Trueperaceae bacterium]MCO5173603.1 zinc metallopeptidase [Trueperaceae bacterium]MCW5820302.1 zinc metallopeptidase [Trueperaceae bacterium]
MKWEDAGRSKNLEDRRAAGPGRAAVPLGIGGVLIILALSAITGTDLFSALGLSPSAAVQPQAATPNQAELEAEEPMVRFVSFVLDDVQSFWHATFEASDLPYQEAGLVLYRDAVSTACGDAPSSAGPFYCPGDQKVYLDLSFFEELSRRYGAPGDFAQAYVIAHELGHHVQNLLGTLTRAQSQGLSVPVELQADCYAGVWGASADRRGVMERGDLQEGLGAAASVGDDTLAKRAGRIPNQETFTHGSSAQRTQWFTTGFQSGDPNACNTFASR